ncbi:hypothetical protein EB796_021929 [Bugula neritina]|uniref:EIF4E3 n=1 Tax=Bugula neritina TaxID=10212 RepID=A0A7J7J1Z3_BUGNE|nr:hypothetical protein EB796_021929 [Bugula neritina]
MDAERVTQKEKPIETTDLLYTTDHSNNASSVKIPDNTPKGVPLNSTWTFWIDRSTYGSSAAQYEANLQKVYTVSTVEEFWSVYNNMPEPSTVENRCSYHLMRGDRKPMWEDPAHLTGGNWKLKCAKFHSNEVWKELLLAVIGEKLSESLVEGDEIGGVSISVRDRDDVLQIWNTKSSLAGNANIHDSLTSLLPQVEFLTFFYKAFESHEAFEGRK